ncbi:MAG: hypothetical protein V3W26_00605 [Thermodesulfobacteriota bacterium]
MTSRRYSRREMWWVKDTPGNKLMVANDGPRLMDRTLTLLIITLHLTFFIAFSGCTKQTELRPSGLSYTEALNRWTREGRIYDGFESRLVVYATYRGWEFREAYVREYVKRYEMDSYQEDKLLADESADYEAVEEFFLAVSTHDTKWNDLDNNNSIWNLYLKNDRGERVNPIDIKRVDEDSPLIKKFYPQMDLWSYGYIIRFPKYAGVGETPLLGDDTISFELIITGVLGKTEMGWRLK